MIRLFRTGLMSVLAALVLAACGGSEEWEARDISEELQAYYAAHPEFFRFRTPAYIPSGLVWEDGMELPDIGSPQAK